MSTFVESIASGLMQPSLTQSTGTSESNPASFLTWVNDEVSEVNQQLLNADSQLRELAAGETSNLHQVMIAIEESRLAFQLTLQVRNKVLEAYQDIMRTQI